ncbi:right-handed parallel beta-helix repeat-containing protein [Wenyingzhuangia sp. 2_MG-2023]|uniref:right-handed parallel beta-helix repeat-containing protein n=1 Tax=Wenyingzhuangia sp. 2_MG-2023 TaxID=3062639 RepID=UPI0026E3EB1D|nr:right-handed parallel beta-helix repeat-containing protein [Wenyingzhuangia sp. 2_MG-2023]MDO6737013.1 right-handed parallel beta-helix repeat-containing protein [Wenyingzhuangia sp. 2_MG-2023]
MKNIKKINLRIIRNIIMVLFTANSFASSISVEPILFKTNIANDATPVVLDRILKLDKTKENQIKFEKGTYHFYSEKGLEKFCYISNHDDVMVRTAFPIFDFKNISIDGQGSTFIFHGKMIPFMIDDSKNVSVKNVTIDWEMSFHSESVIVAVDEKNKTFDMRISEEYPYEIRNNQLYFVKEYYEHDLGQTIMYDPNRKAIMFDTESYTNLTISKKAKVSRNVSNIDYKYEYDHRSKFFGPLGRELSIVIKELEPGLVRVFNHKKKLPPVGMVLASKGSQSVNRLAPAFRVTNTAGFNGTNINIHHAGGMGIIAENSSDLILDNFNITPSKGRMVSTTADATHFVGCSGKVVLRNSTFQNQLDDAMNVHGTYQKIVDVLDENRIGVRMGHSQQQGFVIGKENESIGLVRLSNSFFPYHKLSIKNIQYINGRYQIITFNEELPKEVQPGDLIENLDGYPDLLVENCVISNNRARGLLISNPVKTIVRNNFFSTEMEAILIPVESGHWYESGNGANITIENNVFQDCQHSGFDRGVIRFVTDDDNENIAFRNIKITNNTFNQFDNLILEIANTDGLVFSNNTITNSETFPMLYSENSVVTVKTSKNIIFKKNKYKGKAEIILKKDESISKLKFK